MGTIIESHELFYTVLCNSCERGSGLLLLVWEETKKTNNKKRFGKILAQSGFNGSDLTSNWSNNEEKKLNLIRLSLGGKLEMNHYIVCLY